MAMGLYTALPGLTRWEDESRGWLAPMLPAVGLVLGALWMLVWAVTDGLPALLAAVIRVLALPVATGFLHLDGYMDVADALLSARPREEKLRILKDPHAGSFGVIALASLLLLGTASMEATFRRLPPAVFFVVPVLSRAMAALCVMSLAPLAQSQYARMNHETATPGRRAFACAFLALGWGLAIRLAGGRGAAVCAGATAGYGLASLAAVRGLGGMNGDVAGWAICIAETAALCTAALIM